MKNNDFNNHLSNLRKRVLKILKKHKAEYSFNLRMVFSQSAKSILGSLRSQEEQFADFVIRKQTEIDEMELGFIKTKMQDNLNRISIQTSNHIQNLIEKYNWIVKGDNPNDKPHPGKPS